MKYFGKVVNDAFVLDMIEKNNTAKERIREEADLMGCAPASGTESIINGFSGLTLKSATALLESGEYEVLDYMVKPPLEFVKKVVSVADRFPWGFERCQHLDPEEYYKMKVELVKKFPMNFRDLCEGTPEDFTLEFIKGKVHNLRYVDKPSLGVQMVAVEEDFSALNYIQMPHDRVLEFAFKKYKRINVDISYWANRSDEGKLLLAQTYGDLRGIEKPYSEEVWKTCLKDKAFNILFIDNPTEEQLVYAVTEGGIPEGTTLCSTGSPLEYILEVNKVQNFKEGFEVGLVAEQASFKAFPESLQFCKYKESLPLGVDVTERPRGSFFTSNSFLK